jgi:hypothetical protein
MEDLIFTAVKTPNLTLHPEDGGRKILQNAGILLKHYTASQPRRLQLESPPPQKPKILKIL